MAEERNQARIKKLGGRGLSKKAERKSGDNGERKKERKRKRGDGWRKNTKG